MSGIGVLHETLGEETESVHWELCKLSLRGQKWKDKSWKNTELWHMWFMGHIMAVSGLAAEKGKQAVSDHFGGEKALGWLQLSIEPSLSLSATFSLCLSSSLSLWPPMFCPGPSSLHFYLFLHFIPFVSLSVFSLQYFTEPCVSVAPSVGIWGALPVPSLSFFLFFFCALEV